MAANKARQGLVTDADVSADSPVLQRWHERLTNWALWVVGSNAMGYGSACDGEHSEGAPRPPPPLVGEALDTDTLVYKLADEQREAIRATYVWTGPVHERAAALGVHANVMRDRVLAAKFRLEELRQERRAAMMRMVVA